MYVEEPVHYTREEIVLTLIECNNKKIMFNEFSMCLTLGFKLRTRYFSELLDD